MGEFVTWTTATNKIQWGGAEWIADLCHQLNKG